MTYVHQSVFPLYPPGDERCFRCLLLFVETDARFGVCGTDGKLQGMVHESCLETETVEVQGGVL